jgi:PPP family 3-phenylpropionic acid transporter
LFLGLGIFVPFFPVWLGTRGLSVPEISLVLAAQMIVRLAAGPGLTILSDWLGSRKGVVLGLTLCALASMIVMSQVEGFYALLILGTVASAAWTPIMPLIETLAVAESEDGGADYGRMRLWGSLSFICGSVGSGYILLVAQPETIVWLLIAADVVLVAAALLLPSERSVTARETPRAGWNIAAVLPVIRHPVFMAFVVAASLIQASHAVYYGFGTIHWLELGIADDIIGYLWAIGVISEVGLFMFARRAVALIGPVGLIALGGLGALGRWTATALDPGIAALLAIQCAHALTFGATHLGTMHFIARIAPRHIHASVQGTYAAFSSGVIMALAMSAAGLLYENYAAAAYLAMAGMGAVGALAALYVRYKWDGKLLG